MKNCDECGGTGVVFLISLTDPPTRTTDEIRVERCEKCNRYADNIGAATAVINEWYDAEEIRNGANDDSEEPEEYDGTWTSIGL